MLCLELLELGLLFGHLGLQGFLERRDGTTGVLSERVCEDSCGGTTTTTAAFTLPKSCWVAGLVTKERSMMDGSIRWW